MTRLHEDGYLWIVKHTKTMVEELHMRLEAPVGVDETNMLRGRIIQARDFMADAKRAYETGVAI